MARAACPDIFAPLFQGHSVFQTAALALRGPQMARPLVVVAMAHRFLALGQLAAVGLEAADILALPSPPDATTALGVAALHLQATQGTDVGLLAVPLARALPNLGAVAQAVQAAAPDIAQGQIGQFSPSTGAGASADTGLWFGRASALVQALERDCGMPNPLAKAAPCCPATNRAAIKAIRKVCAVINCPVAKWFAQIVPALHPIVPPTACKRHHGR